MTKKRLDLVLLERGMVESRSLAQRLVMEGKVRVDGQVVLKPSEKVLEEAVVTLDSGQRYVSRGGDKMEAALQAFGLADLAGKTCVDVGSSTGGFTDCLLSHGAVKVFAVDVGYGILHWKLRNDQRVVAMERTNARYLVTFPQNIQVVTVDASFISLKILLPVIRGWLGDQGGIVVPLIKPQFEVGKNDASRGDGVVRDPDLHRKVLFSVLEHAIHLGYEVKAVIRSPLQGPKGNIEFLANLVFPGQQLELLDSIVKRLIP